METFSSFWLIMFSTSVSARRRKVVWRDIELISMWVSEAITFYKRPINGHESSGELVVSVVQEAGAVGAEVTSLFLLKICFYFALNLNWLLKSFCHRFKAKSLKNHFQFVLKTILIVLKNQHTLVHVFSTKVRVLKSIVACKPHNQSSNPTLDMSYPLLLSHAIEAMIRS